MSREAEFYDEEPEVIERSFEGTQWDLTISCPKGWQNAGDEADVVAEETTEPAECLWRFTLVKTPSGTPVVQRVEADIWFDEDSDVDGSFMVGGPYGSIDYEELGRVARSAIRELEAREREIGELAAALSPSHWGVAGVKVDPIMYARLACLYDSLARREEPNIIETLTDLLGIASKETTKSRLRAAKTAGFLTMPGRGQAGTGKATKAAIKLVRQSEGR